MLGREKGEYYCYVEWVTYNFGSRNRSMSRNAWDRTIGIERAVPRT